MIVREEKDRFVLVKQHDHAYVSGDIARHLDQDLFMVDNPEDVILAAYQHDRSWISLDQTAAWNPELSIPYSFADYPLVPKLEAYKQGLDEAEAINKYAGLLCSLHYSSFFDDSSPQASKLFVRNEKRRQESMIKELDGFNERLILRHLAILQFTDRLSLYICLNTPGVGKNQEHPWYKDGIRFSEELNPIGKRPIMASWTNENQVSVVGFPFHKDFHSTLKYKSVPKSAIREIGLEEAYSKAETIEHDIRFTR